MNIGILMINQKGRLVENEVVGGSIIDLIELKVCPLLATWTSRTCGAAARLSHWQRAQLFSMYPNGGLVPLATQDGSETPVELLMEIVP